jgi:hypothetical protein
VSKQLGMSSMAREASGASAAWGGSQAFDLQQAERSAG